MAPGSQGHEASPLVIVLIGLFFMGAGGVRVYLGLLENDGRGAGGEPTLDTDPSWVRRLGSSGIIGVGFVICGLLVVLIGIGQLFS